MARDEGLEELVRDHLAGLPGVSETTMFGGRAWLLRGKLFCGASDRGLLIRLGKGRDGWALGEAGVTPMRSGGRPMTGWVWVEPETFGDDALREKLMRAAVEFVSGVAGN